MILTGPLIRKNLVEILKIYIGATWFRVDLSLQVMSLSLIMPSLQKNTRLIQKITKD